MISRLALVTDAPHFGGAERYILSMAGAARRRGLNPLVIWLPDPTAHPEVFDEAARMSLPVYQAAPETTSSTRRLVRTFNDLLKRHRPDGLVINASGRPRFWLTALLARWRGTPAVWVHQMIEGRDHRQVPPAWLGGRVEGPQLWRIPQTLRHRLAGTAAAAVITLNAADRDRVVRWHGLRHDRIHVVPHGVDGERYRFDLAGRKQFHIECYQNVLTSGDTRPLIVGTAGRLVEGKGVEILLRAMQILAGQAIPVQLVIAGNGPARSNFERQACEMGIAARVRFLGFVADMAGFYSALDVFALCSETESFGLALAEAMACERAVVATPTAGAVRQIEHSRSGWLLRSFKPAELADTLATLARDPQKRASMGAMGRQRALAHFGIDLTLERTLRALRGQSRERSSPRWVGMDMPRFATMAGEDLA